MKSYVLTALLALVVSACVTDKAAPTYATAPTPTVVPDRATLYVYRVSAQPTAWPSYLQIDGKDVVSLAQQGFTWVYVSPGTRKFKYGFPALAGMPTVKFEQTMEAGKVYAFEMQGYASYSEGQLVYIPDVEFAVAEKTMKECCRYVPPKIAP